MRTRLTRSSFASSLACPRLGWFSRLLTPPAELSTDHGTLAERFSAEEQREIHPRAHALFPNATLVTRQAYDAACWQTQDLIERKSTVAVLEAAFGTATCRARADALVRANDAWRLYEVWPESRPSAAILNDTAFIWMVIAATGLNLEGASLLLVSDHFRGGMSDRELFQVTDVSGQVRERATQFAHDLPTIEAQTRSAEPPPPRMVAHCQRCPLFNSCTGAGVEHSVFELPHMTTSQLNTLLGRGWRAISDIEDEALLHGRQKSVWRSVRDGKINVGEGLGDELQALQWPVHYLNLETSATVLPLFDTVAPFERQPYLYSVRVSNEPGRLGAHRAFLSSHDKENSRELTERLLQDLGSAGTILAYSHQATRVLKAMARRHPNLAQPLAGTVNRVVDLRAIIRRNLYHPGFHGKLDFRAVLAAMVPGLTYIDLEIEESATASAAFAFLCKRSYYSPVRAPLVRRDLYSYAARNTLALMRLHEALRAMQPQA